MTTGIRSDVAGFGALQYGGEDKLRFGSDNSGHLAGFRNILINGAMRINQRGVTIAAAANGAYGPDRWKKVDASNMTQIVEEVNYKPSTTYTLSGTGVTTQQITSPASGNWTLPNIPIAATNVQLEEGSIATPFEQRPIGLELSLCQRYYQQDYASNILQAFNQGILRVAGFKWAAMRVPPSLTLRAFHDVESGAAATISNLGDVLIDGVGVINPATGVTAGKYYGVNFTRSAEL